MSDKLKWLPWTLLVLALTACGGDDDDDNNNDDEDNEPVAAYRFMAASPNAPGISMLVDGDPDDDEDGSALTHAGSSQAIELGYGQASRTPAISPDVREFTLRESVPVEIFEQEYQELMEPFQIELQNPTRYDIVVAGEYPDLERVVFESPVRFDESDTRARVTLLNMSTAMPEMDVHITVAGEPIDSSTLAASLGSREMDNTLRLETGSYQIKVTEPGSSDVLFTSRNLLLVAGDDVTYMALDNVFVRSGVTGQPPIALGQSFLDGNSTLLLGEESGADLRVGHASPETGDIDVLVDDQAADPLAEDLSYGSITGYTSLESGVHNFKAAPANSASNLFDVNFNLLGGVAYTLYAMEPFGSVDPLFVSENSRPIGAYARMRVIQGSSLAGTVDVYITPEGADLGATEVGEDSDEEQLRYPPALRNLSLKNVRGYFALEGTTVDITFADEQDVSGDDELTPPEVVYGPVTVTLENGGIYTLLLRDDAGFTGMTHQWVDGDPEAAANE